MPSTIPGSKFQLFIYTSSPAFHNAMIQSQTLYLNFPPLAFHMPWSKIQLLFLKLESKIWLFMNFPLPCLPQCHDLKSIVYLYSCPSRRHKPQSFIETKGGTSDTLIQKTSKNEPKHGPKNGTAWRSHFWDRMHSLVKEQKKSSFTVPFLGPSGGTKNETAKSQNQQQRPTRATNKKWQLRLVKRQAYRVGTEEARTCEAWFQLTFRPQKWNLKAHMWYQLSPFPIAPMRRLQCSTTQATFTNPSLLRATPLLRGMFYFNYPM